MSAALMLLTPERLAVLRLLEDADLDVLPVDGAWSITDPEHTGALALIARGPTLAAAVDAALPVAVREGYVSEAAVDAVLYADDAVGVCGRCHGCGEGATERHNCPACGGSGVARGAR